MNKRPAFSTASGLMALEDARRNRPRLARKYAIERLEHAIRRFTGDDGWPIGGESDTVHTLRHCQWGLEAMDYPVSNRFWDGQRREYAEMIARINPIDNFGRPKTS